jgi:dihydroorotate dehydrogenase (NAD+) catalytic subunit
VVTGVKIGRVRLNNPVCVASGTFGYAQEMKHVVNLNKLGAIFTKAITREPRPGNMPPRIVETPSGMLNAIGLANVGVDSFIRDKMKFLRTLKTKTFVNVAGYTIKDYQYVVAKLNPLKGIHGYEINISCPNVKKGGITFSASTHETRKMVRAMRIATKRTLIIKLSPNVADISEYARVCEGEGADAVSLINTLIGMSVDIYTRRPRLSNVTGGLSGPAIRPVGVAMTYKASRAVKIPVIGIGGIMNTMDALEYIIAGASAVQVGTGNFVDPKIPESIVSGLKKFMRKEKIKRFKDLVGSMKG